jgi:protein phosphatase
MTRYDWKSAARSEIGRVRGSNEDSVFTSPQAGVFVVADGMGGHAAGEVASAIASRTIGDQACKTCNTLDDQSRRLVEAFREAGREISREVAEEPARAGMGTTATALRLRRDGSYVIAHIGDSRAYLSRDGRLERVTKDHSWVQEQLERGLIAPEQARGHPQSNIITRALGTDPDPTPDLYPGELRAGDLFLLATDGLTDMVPEEEIGEVLARNREEDGTNPDAEGSLQAVADALVDAANRAGGVDNITVLVVRVEEE